MRLTASLSLPRVPDSLARARQVLDTLLSLTDASADRRDLLSLLITEACTNAVMHGKADPFIQVSITVDVVRCLIEVCNSGDSSHWSHLLTEPPGPPDPLAQSGRGLPLMAALADSVTVVDAEPGQVLLRIAKDLR